MSKTKVLFINSEIVPYMPESRLSTTGRLLAQGIQEAGYEIRTFMPRFGQINERRNQLHEVIRLSGMNLIINDTDHPLIIKVASVQAVRMQVYFIDNDEYFSRRGPYCPAETTKPYADTSERMLFFARGVIETIIKLRWTPDIVYCQGWFAMLAPLLIKKCFNENPSFRHARVVTAFYDDAYEGHLTSSFTPPLYPGMRREGIHKADIAELKDKAVTATDLYRLGVKFSDGLIVAAPSLPESVGEMAQRVGCPTLDVSDSPETDIARYAAFFDSLLPADVPE